MFLAFYFTLNGGEVKVEITLFRVEDFHIAANDTTWISEIVPFKTSDGSGEGLANAGDGVDSENT